MPSLSTIVDPRPLAIARIGVGISAMLNFVEAYVTMGGVAEGKLALPLWEWLPPVTGTTLLVFAALTIPAAVALVAGLFARVAAAWVTGCAWFMFAWDQQTYSNHMMLCAWLALWLVFSRSDAVWSVRARLEGPGQVRFGDQVLLMSQLSVCYFFAALVKVNVSFLSGETLKQMLMLELPGWMFGVMAVTTVIVEFFLVVGLWVPRLRALACLAGVGLHMAIPIMMPNWFPLLSFSLLCLSLYPLYWAVTSRAEPRTGPASTQPRLKSGEATASA